jgi:hypothetical protein
MKKCFLSCDEKLLHIFVLDFSDALFIKCFLVLLFRRKFFFKYHDIKLTEKSTNEYG